MNKLTILLLLFFSIILVSCDVFTLFPEKDWLKSFLSNQKLVKDINMVNNASWNSDGFFSVNGTGSVTIDSSGLHFDGGAAIKNAAPLGKGKKMAVEIELGLIDLNNCYPIVIIKPVDSTDFGYNAPSDPCFIYSGSIDVGYLFSWNGSEFTKVVSKNFKTNQVIHILSTDKDFRFYYDYEAAGAILFNKLKRFYWGSPTLAAGSDYQYQDGYTLSITGTNAYIKRIKIYELN
jgi:hypothetical protein